MPASRPETLDFPFFTLEYRDGVFMRLIPADARDLGGGLFRQGTKTWKLGDDETGAALREACIAGRPLLSLLKRLPHPLIAAGPRLAREGERLMELSLAGAAVPAAGELGAGPLRIALRRLRPETEGDWLPVQGLPRHRLYQNVVYEIIDEAAVREFASSPDRSGHFTLRGEDIPRFVDAHCRLVFQAGDHKLKKVLAEDSVFVRPERLSLVLRAFRTAGGPAAAPFVRYGERRYPADEVSRRMDREYVLLDRQWARRDDLKAAGLLPLLCYAGGAAITEIRLKPGELLRRGSERLVSGLCAGLETDANRWLERGDREAIFHAHLEFLLTWGLSGGVTISGHREQAAYSVAFLIRLAASGEGGVLALMEKRYYELYLPLLLPELAAGNIALPGAGRKSGDTRARIDFYEDLPQSPLELRNPPGVLLLLEPEEVLHRAETLAQLQGIKAGMRLGIFSDTGELFRGPAAAAARHLCGVTEPELLPYLIRDTARSLSLPAFAFPPRQILRPPVIAGEAVPYTFTVDERFAGLSGPALYSELALFQTDGPPAPFVPLRLLKGDLDIDRMDPAERAFFVYWRGEFRKGNVIASGASYIRVYARELCLFSGGKDGPTGNFRELFKLWERYREAFDSINGFLPRWIVDYAVIYAIADNALPELLPHAREWNDPIVTDLYLHGRFITGNNSVAFEDAALLIPEVIYDSVFFSREPRADDPRFSAQRQRLVKDFETVINAVDRGLREQFRIRLFEFFYPHACAVETREAFADMERAGRSSYTVRGIRFTKHPPLIRFLGDLFRYTEYCFRLKNGFELKGPARRAPPLDAVWKQFADIALGLADRELFAPGAALRHTAGVPGSAAPPQTQRRSIALRETKIESLRADSDKVRDLLMIEDESEARNIRTPVSHRVTEPETPGTASVTAFVNGLGEAERELLRYIARHSPAPHAELETIARRYRAMPELLIDGINAAFLERFADLLIDTADGAARIEPEHADTLRQ